MKFDMDNSAADKFSGYLTGIADAIETPKYLESAIEYASSILRNRYEGAVDLAARLNPEKFHHIYEWGNDYGDYSTVGVPQMRLWKIIENGRGNSKSLGYTFLPSVRPVPIEPELLEPGKNGQVVKEGVHIFTWKATVMEYGQTVRIEPKLRQVKSMAFVVDGKVIFRKTPVITQPGMYNGNAGAFTGITYAWWGTQAEVIFSNEIRPVLERNLVPRNARGQFVKWSRDIYRRRATLNQMSDKIHFDSGRSQAIKDMQRQSIDYVGEAQKRRDDLYAD